MWMLLVLVYGVLKGTREIVKKKSLQRSSVLEVLFFYTLFAFLFVCFDAPNAGGVDAAHMGFIALKSFIIFLAWMFSFKAIKKMPISLYGILDLSRVLFATLLATIVMRETLSRNQIIGLVLVSAGLLMLKSRGMSIPWLKKKVTSCEFDKEKVDITENDENTVADKTEQDKNKLVDITKQSEKEKVPTILVIFALASCMLNAVSGLMDKLLMRNISSSQLQFWYMLFLMLFYLVYIIVRREKIRIKESLKNPWIWLLALLFVIADRALFIANGDPDSRISIMTLIKQSGCIVTILAGKLIFHEKNIAHKLICAIIIIAGIVIAVL